MDDVWQRGKGGAILGSGDSDYATWARIEVCRDASVDKEGS